MNKNNIPVRTLDLSDLHENALEHFNRLQITDRVRYNDSRIDDYKQDHFVDDWNDADKSIVIEMLRACLSSGGIVAGAYDEDKLVGFASVENERFGKNVEYCELSLMHISNEYRNHGAGRKLFELCCERAKDKGVKKLYIAAHPAKETQQFYIKMGCVRAKEINPGILNKEPRDIQLEIDL